MIISITLLNIVKKSLLVLTLFINMTLPDITCYYCPYTDLDKCGNRTITCRQPADACYVLLSESKDKVEKSCSWAGHCIPMYICGKKDQKCDLHCCGDGLCNHDKVHRDVVRILAEKRRVKSKKSDGSRLISSNPVYWLLLSIYFTWYMYLGDHVDL